MRFVSIERARMSSVSNSQTLTILIKRQPNGEYAAIDEVNYDLGSPVGYGKTERAAIDDLIAQMDERGLIEDHSQPVLRDK